MTALRMSPAKLNAWLDSIRARAEKLVAEMIAENEDTKRRWKDIQEAHKQAIGRTAEED